MQILPNRWKAQALVLIAMSHISAAASAADFYVDTGGTQNCSGVSSCCTISNPCSSIQDAVDQAADTDTVNIAAGHYYESGIYIGKSIVLRGDTTNPPIIDGSQGGADRSIIEAQAGWLVFDHLRIENGQCTDPVLGCVSAGIHVTQASATYVSNVEFYNNVNLRGTVADAAALIVNSNNIVIGGSRFEGNSGVNIVRLTDAGANPTPHFSLADVSFVSNDVQQWLLTLTNGKHNLTDVRSAENRKAEFGDIGTPWPFSPGVVFRATSSGTQLSVDNSALIEDELSGIVLFPNNNVSSTPVATITNTLIKSSEGSAVAIMHSGYQHYSLALRSTTLDSEHTSALQVEAGHLVLPRNSAISSCNIDEYSSVDSQGFNADYADSCSLTASTDKPTGYELGLYNQPEYHGSMLDAGDPSGCTAFDGTLLKFDLAGRPRDVDGNSDGTPRCDIGAYEYIPAGY